MSELYEDLLKDVSESFEDGNYFLLTITELELGTTYPLEFRWKYKDGTVGKDWSAVYNLSTPIRTVPNEPRLLTTDVVGGAGFIKVNWSGNDASGNPLENIDRVDIHISGTSFGDGTKPSGSFKIAGTQTFTAEPGVYIVQLKTITVNGESSFFSDARTVTVTAVGEVIQTPTLPSGLSVATAPFAVTVNWSGTYSASSFTGFKSIDIYAVSSDLGSSVTSGITSTNLVGSLTVNDTPNKINISLDNLRQALSLSTNSDVYSASIFYYYNATNKDGTKYGSPTYTRINSSSVVPTKANFIDLASGVISIENLVAGNGNFSSWLRTGTAGGARIELSAVSDFSNSGNTVQKGLTAYSSGNSEIFKLDLDSGALTINGSGTFSGNLSAAGGTFTGTLSAATGSFSGTITANGGTIGGITIAAAALQNNSVESSSTFKLDSAGKARFGAFSGNAIIINPTANIGSAYLFHSANGGSSASDKFSFLQSGGFRLGGSNGINYDGSSSLTIGSSGNPITINTSTGAVSISGVITAGNLTDGTTTISGNNITTGTITGRTVTVSGSTVTTTISGSTGIISIDDTSSGGLYGGGINISSSSRSSTLGGSGLSWTEGSNTGAIYMSSGIVNLKAGSAQSVSITADDGLNRSTYPIYMNGHVAILNAAYIGDSSSNEASTADSAHMSTGRLTLRRFGNTPLFLHRTESGTGPLRVATFYIGGVAAGGINAYTGQAAIFVNPSDYRMKENIQDYSNASAIIKKTRLRKFNFKSSPQEEIVGFIAHEYAEVDPKFVIGEKDAVDEQGNPIYQEMMMGAITPYLIGALKESILKIEQLEARLDALEG